MNLRYNTINKCWHFYYSLIRDFIKNMNSGFFCPSTQDMYMRRAHQRKQNITKKLIEPLKPERRWWWILAIQTKEWRKDARFKWWVHTRVLQGDVDLDVDQLCRTKNLDVFQGNLLSQLPILHLPSPQYVYQQIHWTLSVAPKKRRQKFSRWIHSQLTTLW